jgi:hypothetical protein
VVTQLIQLVLCPHIPTTLLSLSILVSPEGLLGTRQPGKQCSIREVGFIVVVIIVVVINDLGLLSE